MRSVPIAFCSARVAHWQTFAVRKAALICRSILRKNRAGRIILAYWSSLSFLGLVFASVFFSLSVTPSLIPRNYLAQGLLSGFAMAVGYGLAMVIVWAYEFMQLRRSTGKVARVFRWCSAATSATIFVTFTWRMAFWQNSIRELMGMERLQSAYPYRVAGIAIVVSILIVATARLFLRSGFYVSERLERVLPRRLARMTGFSIVVVLGLFLTNDVIAVKLLDSADSFFLRLDKLVTDDIAPGAHGERTDNDESLVAWESIGRQGKLFLTTGPTRDEISRLTGREAKSPIRVYVGMRSRPTHRERAELALQELKRVGGFERSILVVATPTGTGWLDPSAVDTLEVLHGGDCAIVSTQYSYLPSWITLLVDSNRSISSAESLFDQVYSYWKTLPKNERPRLYLHGLSLGSLGSELSADLYTVFEDPIQGAVWSGPPFPSHNWQQIVAHRNEGSPAWLPRFRDGRMLRFTNQEDALSAGPHWGPIRSVYIQYASDPMIWFSPDLAWNRPDWLQEPRGPDVSPHLRWYPIVTFLQVAFDLPLATSVPIGHGHNYSPSSYIDAWTAVTAPEGWTSAEIDRLKNWFGSREAPKP